MIAGKTENLRGRVPRNVFVVLGLPRAGTTWLLDLLHSHPLVCSPNEILIRNPFVHGVPGARRKRLQASHHGFKILDWQNGWWLQELMERREPAVILLWRRNMVRQLYSLKAAALSGIYHEKPIARQVSERLRHGCRALARFQFGYACFAVRSTAAMLARRIGGGAAEHAGAIRIIPEELDRFAEKAAARVALLRAALEKRGGPWLEITYEELSGASHGATVHRIQEFLGLPPSTAGSAMRAMNARPLPELLANHDEIEDHCRNHGMLFE